MNTTADRLPTLSVETDNDVTIRKGKNMNNKAFYLKVKRVSLADEARYIRSLERKVKAKGWHREEEHINKTLLNGLQSHRRKEVRSEARAAHLINGMLAGKKYRELEPAVAGNNSPGYILPQLTRIYRTFAPNDKIPYLKDRFEVDQKEVTRIIMDWLDEE